ncbi:zinc-binding dehydrogenase [Gordonia sp. HNM0687]|uniref:Zinc-binding dehydrogenase n=1 Tax=Gordonia mangrovi TaxID=2665643 RepID=A0A6L7GVC3_9ACTN|nr:NADP-dependent oxidoreductase [Gordonia mangrovi]MXP23523.1 zinc-binding dehydrogenase [Gordonia mangrovi]UVF76582.1 NADP-dependent oxidoreductase [Gordonia mangrovi]
MRAFVLPEFDVAPDVIDVDIPEPAEGEVRVRIHAASINGFDLAVAGGSLNGMMDHRFPVVLGKDFAGEIDAVGAGVTDYRIGDRVFGVVTKPYLGDGSFAEYVTVPTAVGLAKLPEGIDFVTGAGLGLAGSAALAAVDAAELSEGQRLLVVGATGGVGNQVVQLAARAGAQVLATAATEEATQHLTGLGAAEIVDHTDDLGAAVKSAHPAGVDVVVHLAGDPTALVDLVRSGGRIVSTIVPPGQQLAENVETVGIYAQPDAATLGRLGESVAAGDANVSVQRTFTLDEAAAAFDAFAGGTLGKIVITVR